MIFYTFYLGFRKFLLNDQQQELEEEDDVNVWVIAFGEGVG